MKVCLVQDSPVFFDKTKTIEKCVDLTVKYARMGCSLIVFPESFIPGYPRGFSFGAVVGSRTDEGRQLYQEYYNNSINLDSKDLLPLLEAAKSENVYLVIGVTESNNTNGSLYCSMVYISPQNGLLGVHRKIKPTGTERIIWGESDGTSLVTFDTSLGCMGGLICWENYMPLARMSMYQKGVEIYIAPTADARPEWIASMQHIALEGRCFVLSCNQFMTRKMIPEKYQNLIADEPDEMCPGGSVIVSPLGKIIAGPLIGTAGAVVADIDLEDIKQSKLDFDVSGHYSRPDIFTFEVKDQPPTRQE